MTSDSSLLTENKTHQQTTRYLEILDITTYYDQDIKMAWPKFQSSVPATLAPEHPELM